MACHYQELRLFYDGPKAYAGDNGDTAALVFSKSPESVPKAGWSRYAAADASFR